jgi:hypothetical protein|tara:strand:+ start:33567 stop:33761 length:195 start_codon:yes stop_codon:yes gene_type:complete
MKPPTNKDRYDGLYAHYPDSLSALLEGETSALLGYGGSPWTYSEQRGTGNLGKRSLWLPIEYMK